MKARPLMGYQQRGWTGQHQRGGILICVLIVLLAAGGLMMSGMRLIMASSSSQEQRTKVIQAQELVQLGRLVLQQQLGAGVESSTPKTDATQASTTQLPSIELSFAARPGGTALPALITLQRVSMEDSAAEAADAQWRIVARYPYNQPGEVQASWQGKPGQ